jgi:hypothetical protein
MCGPLKVIVAVKVTGAPTVAGLGEAVKLIVGVPCGAIKLIVLDTLG